MLELKKKTQSAAMLELLEESKSRKGGIQQGRWRIEECTRAKACLLPLIHELTALLAIEAELIANLVLVRLVLLAHTAINPACVARRTTITFLIV